jgi:hypothetical protein
MRRNREWTVPIPFHIQTGVVNYFRGDDGGLVKWWLRPLMRHLQEKQIGEPLKIIAVEQSCITQDVAKVPELLDNRRRPICQ